MPVAGRPMLRHEIRSALHQPDDRQNPNSPGHTFLHLVKQIGANLAEGLITPITVCQINARTGTHVVQFK